MNEHTLQQSSLGDQQIPGPSLPIDLVDRTKVYDQLRAGFATYEDLKAIPIEECGEPLVAIEQAPGLTYFQRSPGMVPDVGNKVFVRSGILEKLQRVGQAFTEKYPGYSIAVLEGYRPLGQQKKEFQETIQALKQQTKFAKVPDDDPELMNEAHLRVANPEVGDHVAGCGVDVVIIDENGVMVDMGTKMSEWVDESYTYSPFISQDGKNAREVLVEEMAAQEMDNFGAEFWHFMNGGRESAFLHGYDHAKYGPRDFQDAELQRPVAELERGMRFMRYLGCNITERTRSKRYASRYYDAATIPGSAGFAKISLSNRSVDSINSKMK